MQITPDQMHQATTSRFTRGDGDTGVGRRYRLEGDARPGDVLALAGGALVDDCNENGFVDGDDVLLPDPATGLGRLLDVRG
jgi:hypothetical protein